MQTITRKRYPSDLTEEQWAILKPLVPQAKQGGRHRTVDMREILNAIFYLNRSGCQWDMLPHDLPPKDTVRCMATLLVGETTARGSASWMLCGFRCALLKAIHRRPAPVRSTAKPSKQPRLAENAATTAARRSQVENAIFSWMFWGSCWRWQSPARRSTMLRRLPK